MISTRSPVTQIVRVGRPRTFIVWSPRDDGTLPHLSAAASPAPAGAPSALLPTVGQWQALVTVEWGPSSTTPKSGARSPTLGRGIRSPHLKCRGPAGPTLGAFRLGSCLLRFEEHAARSAV